MKHLWGRKRRRDRNTSGVQPSESARLRSAGKAQGRNVMLSEREILMGIFNLIGATARRMTGLTPIVTFVNAAGEEVLIHPAEYRVEWIKPDLVSESAAAPLQKVC
jgi:hypothetical protein